MICLAAQAAKRLGYPQTIGYSFRIKKHRYSFNLIIRRAINHFDHEEYDLVRKMLPISVELEADPPPNAPTY